MNKAEKVEAVDSIAAGLEESEAVFAIDYQGLTVQQAKDLRSQLRESDASFHIVKNTLANLAADKASALELKPLLKGPTALTLIRGDVASAAKSITKFRKEHEVLDFKGGVLDGKSLSIEEISALAKLPSRDQLYGQLVGIVASPITTLTRGLGSMISGLAISLEQVRQQKENDQ